jgi:hypothetical protein
MAIGSDSQRTFAILIVGSMADLLVEFSPITYFLRLVGENRPRWPWRLVSNAGACALPRSPNW